MEVRNVNPVVEVVVGQHLLRARGIMDTGVGGVELANPRIRRIHMPHALTPMRVEVATEAMMADIGMLEDMGMAEDITGVMNLLVSRCTAASRSETMGRAVAPSFT